MIKYKKNITITLLTCVFFVSVSTLSYARLRDPFESQLPKPKPTVDKDKTANQAALTREQKRKQRQNANMKIQPKVTPKAEPTPPAINISGLIWNSDRPQAIINGQVMDVGDMIGDAKIIKIKKSGIDYEFNGETLHKNL
jgi:hypothetical protein